MPTASKQSVYTNPVSSERPEDEISVASNQSLSRIIFDDLFENDLLGFLLSSHHFCKYLGRLESQLDRFSARHIKQIVSNSTLLQEFHASTLEMFAGVYIEECKHKSHGDLMRDLDNKYQKLKNLNECSEFASSSLVEKNNVEMAWLYRKTCNGGESLFSKS